MHDLVEAMEKGKKIKELKQKLVECFESEIATKGLGCVDTEEAGEVIDMIKDLAEAEKACMEALYYQKVTEAMLSYDEPRYGESMGYNPNRSRSTGRYTSGRGGRRMGFTMPHEPWTGENAGEWDGDMYMESAMMGYDGGGASTGRGSGSSGNRGGSRGGSSGGSSSGQSMGYGPGREMMEDMDPRYGEEYNRYKKMRRHYTETKSAEDKREMSEHAEKHIHDTVDTMKDIWKDADPELKRKMKEELTKLVGTMNM